MNPPANFDQAHTKRLEELWRQMEPPTSTTAQFNKAHRDCRAFAFFCAGIVDSLFHKLKTDCPQAVKGFKGFTIPE